VTASPTAIDAPRAHLLRLTGQSLPVRLYGAPALHRALPTPLAVRLAAVRGHLEWYASGRRRKVATRAVRILTGASAGSPEARRLARRRVVEEAVRAELEWRPWFWRKLEPEGAEQLEIARRMRGGRLIVAAFHLGPYIALPHVVAGRGLRPYVAHPDWTSEAALHGRRGRWTLHQMRSLEEHGGRWIPRGSSYRALVELLERGETCMFALDVPGREEVRLAGRVVRVRRGVATLARRTGAPIVPALAFRDRGRATAVFFPVVDPVEFADSASLLQHVFDVLGPTVAAHAEQADGNVVRLVDVA
jgi:lauroyl/myristoyl acyltransferase